MIAEEINNMKTLDEAIKCYEQILYIHNKMKQVEAVTLEDCKRAEEYRHLIDWLKELKELKAYREAESEGLEMFKVKYPEWIEVQLKILDERIEEIYRELAEIKVKPDKAMQIKKNLYEQTKPFVDEKIRLIANSHPTYIVDGVTIKKSEEEK